MAAIRDRLRDGNHRLHVAARADGGEDDFQVMTGLPIIEALWPLCVLAATACRAGSGSADRAAGRPRRRDPLLALLPRT